MTQEIQDELRSATSFFSEENIKNKKKKLPVQCTVITLFQQMPYNPASQGTFFPTKCLQQ
jgi:hypothetical protein